MCCFTAATVNFYPLIVTSNCFINRPPAKRRWCVILVLSVLLSVCLYVCQTITFESLTYRKFIFAHLVYFEGIRVKLSDSKVTGATEIESPYSRHGRRSLGNGGGQFPQNLEWGTLMQIVPPRFCHIGTKMSVLWPSKYATIRFLCPADPAGGAHDAHPDPLVGWIGDTSPHTPPHWARTHLRRSPCAPRIPARSTPMIPAM